MAIALHDGKPYKTPPVLQKAIARAMGPEARKVLREYREELAYPDRVSQVVDQAPPLTDQQWACIRVLFMGSAPYVTRQA
ncbi:hypothetical protein AB0C59_20845 [Streptomyces sp. NPDC048664]|uniref:hypothetical protein n=1 Tax=Streptomyces sp. NPDC048664 TaxID=3154505 RepID=UPI00341DCE3A